MNKISFILVLFVVLLSSCNLYHGGTIKQEIVLTENMLNLNQKLMLKTTVSYKNNIISETYDDTEGLTAEEIKSIKCSRYEEGKVLIDKVIDCLKNCDND